MDNDATAQNTSQQNAHTIRKAKDADVDDNLEDTDPLSTT